MILLAILLTNAAGFYFYYAAALQHLRWEQRARLAKMPARQLDRLILSLNEYSSAKVDEHEIRWQGKMFDVARVVAAGDSLHVYGLYDPKEDSLLSLADHFLTSPFDSDKMPDVIKQYLSLQFLVPESACTGDPLLISASIEKPYVRNFTNALLATPSHPPRSC